MAEIDDSKLMVEPNYGQVPRPDHVLPEQVVEFDYRAPIPAGEDNYTVLSRLQQHGPDILWTPCNGGHWIVVRSEDIRWVQENFGTFSHEVFMIPRGSTRIVMPPLTVDPPLHARFRAVLNPFFKPSKVAAMRDKARGLAIDLIERIVAKGRCEVVADFASVLPGCQMRRPLRVGPRAEACSVGNSQISGAAARSSRHAASSYQINIRFHTFDASRTYQKKHGLILKKHYFLRILYPF
jgi:hypothetical protein